MPPSLKGHKLTRDLVNDAEQRLLSRIDATAAQCLDRCPHAADSSTGEWVSRAGVWTDGFWPALCWTAYETTGQAHYREVGTKAALGLRSRTNQQTHDIGFLFYYGAVLGWQKTGDDRLRAIALDAASQLASMFHDVARVIPVGAHADVSSGLDDVTIDCLMNLQLLWWAADETGDSLYRDVALAHAERTAVWHTRANGSCFQSVHFDRRTGQPSRRHTHQGFAAETCWSRGLAWCCYGFVEAYRATRRDDFLRLAQRAFDYHCAHAPEDGILFNDYEDPRIPNASRDTSAAAIAASAFLRLATTTAHGDRELTAASQLLEALIVRCLTPIDAHDTRPTGMLLHGCYNEGAGDFADNELIWGDYFLLEALIRWREVAPRV